MRLQPHEEGSLSWGHAARVVHPSAKQRAGAGATEAWGDKRTCYGRDQGGLFSPDSSSEDQGTFHPYRANGELLRIQGGLWVALPFSWVAGRALAPSHPLSDGLEPTLVPLFSSLPRQLPLR